ncbi:MAG: M56 family metallopeptidase, partial [Polaribacter sp.]
EESFDYTLLFIGIYLLISFVFLIRFGKNLFKIIQKIRSNETIKHKKAILVLVDNKILPHTFWKHIFINKKQYKQGKIEEELFTHELTHVTQKHSLDVLLIEVLQIVFWINPLFIFLKKAVQLNHEFLADETVINQHKNTFQYQHLLLNKAAWNNEYYLASNLNYSLTKKRLLMMTTQSSQTKVWIKKLTVIPLLAAFIFLFAERVEAQEISKKTKIEEKFQIRKHSIEVPKNFPTTGFQKIKGIQRFYVLKNNKKTFYNLEGQIIDSNGKILSQKQANATDILPGQYITKIYSLEGGIVSRFKDNMPISNTKNKTKLIEENRLRAKKVYDNWQKKENSIGTIEDIRLKLKSVNAIKINKDTIPSNVVIKNEKLSATKSEIREYKKLLAKGKKAKIFKKKDVLKMQYLYNVMSKKQKNSVENVYHLIPPPPPPVSTLDYVIKMAKKDATFYYEDEEIISDKAIELIKKNKHLNIDAGSIHLTNPVVRISKKAITFKSIDGDKNGKPTYYLDGKIISEKELQKLKPDNTKSINVKKNKDGSGSVYITSKKE